jgi:thiol-disulfide isomerase/thioredoxin
MKKSVSLILTLSIIIVLSSCTLPWQKTTPETETIIEDLNNTNTVTPTAVEEQKFTDITPSDTPKSIAEGGVYLPYTSTAVAQAKGEIVLFFYANWCPTCGAINKDIEAKLAEIPKNLTLLKVNYDDEVELKKLY